VEARTELQQRADLAAHAHAAGRRGQHAGDQLQQRGFSGAVLADEAQRFAAADLQIHVAQDAESSPPPPLPNSRRPSERRRSLLRWTFG
jgi:hypothetical protein